MVQAYFEDMKCILQQLYRRAKSDAQVWLVVSTSAYGGVEIPVDLILANIGTQSGWFLREIGVIRQIRHSGHHWSRLPEEERPTAKLRESVVVFEDVPQRQNKRLVARRAPSHAIPGVASRESAELRVGSTCRFEDFDPTLQSPVVLFERADQIIPQFPVIPLSKNVAL